FQLAPGLPGREGFKRRVVNFMKIGLGALHFRFPFAARKTPGYGRFYRLQILIASLPDAQGEPVAVKLLFRSIKVGRDEVAVRALARLHACDAHIREYAKFPLRNAKFQFGLEIHSTHATSATQEVSIG